MRNSALPPINRESSPQRGNFNRSNPLPLNQRPPRRSISQMKMNHPRTPPLRTKPRYKTLDVYYKMAVDGCVSLLATWSASTDISSSVCGRLSSFIIPSEYKEACRGQLRCVPLYDGPESPQTCRGIDIGAAWISAFVRPARSRDRALSDRFLLRQRKYSRTSCFGQ
jgi:hypothetical protein